MTPLNRPITGKRDKTHSSYHHSKLSANNGAFLTDFRYSSRCWVVKIVVGRVIGGLLQNSHYDFIIFKIKIKYINEFDNWIVANINTLKFIFGLLANNF